MDINGKIVTIDGQNFKVVDGRLVPVLDSQKSIDLDMDLVVDKDENIVGRLTTLSEKQADDTGLPKDTTTIVLSDRFTEGYTLQLVQVVNNNKKEFPQWSEGDYIGTRKEWALVLKKVD